MVIIALEHIAAILLSPSFCIGYALAHAKQRRVADTRRKAGKGEEGGQGKDRGQDSSLHCFTTAGVRAQGEVWQAAGAVRVTEQGRERLAGGTAQVR